SATEDYENPLTVVFNIKGGIGTPTGKRLFVPADLFVSNDKPVFPHEKRELDVYFQYSNMVQDAVRISFPQNIKAESVPAIYKDQFEKSIAYALSNEQTPNSVTIRRDFDLGQFFFENKQYPALRTFYSKVEGKDQEKMVLITSPVAAPVASVN
ncbi:MAG TPA: transglutaminase, partial [Edaphobacter sp.]|nr:transglutaminase [Edaphobacter sp.]